MSLMRSSAWSPVRDLMLKHWLDIVGSWTPARSGNVLEDLGCELHLPCDWITALLHKSRLIGGRGRELSYEGWYDGSWSWGYSSPTLLSLSTGSRNFPLGNWSLSSSRLFIPLWYDPSKGETWAARSGRLSLLLGDYPSKQEGRGEPLGIWNHGDGGGLKTGDWCPLYYPSETYGVLCSPSEHRQETPRNYPLGTWARMLHACCCLFP